MPISKQQSGRYGGLKSWANTTDRTARTAKARRNGPSQLEWHLDRLDPERFADATDAQRLAAAEAARRAYYARLSMRSAETRRRKSRDGAA